MLSDAKASPRLTGLSLQESLLNHHNREEQMTGRTFQTGASLTWEMIDWKVVKEHVRRLQMRIAKAIREGKYGKAKSLQWLLSRSFYAKLLAVKRVSENKGKKTPGVDGVIWNTDNKKMNAVRLIKRRGYQPQALKRVYIPKKNGKLRPLGIPCMIDKAQQGLYLLGLEPISETLADKNSYGFRPKRSAADAIAQCFIALGRKTSSKWVLEGDIKACFDKIGRKWLLNNIPMDKQILEKWLTAGYIDKGIFYHTEEGTPQGGIISPTLMLLTLRGLEEAAKQAAPKKSYKINVIAYADDFIITGDSKEVLVDKVKPAVEAFLKERNLELSQEKTKITHIDDGFDFLGFNLRKYNGKLLIKPAKQNVLGFIRKIRGVIKSHKAASSGELICILNPKIKGWGNYYRHVVSKQTFSYVDYGIFRSTTQWAKRRHPNKGCKWVMQKYFFTKSSRWDFNGITKRLNGEIIHHKQAKMVTIPIRRHIKIRSEANPYDPDYQGYFDRRKDEKRRNTWKVLPEAAL